MADSKPATIKTPPLVNTATIECRQQRVRAVRFNVDGAYCLTCGDDKKLRLWNPWRSLPLKTYGGHADSVLDACGSCDSSHIVSCGGDKSLILWDVATAQPLRRYRSHAAAVTCVRYNEESTMAVSGSVDNTVMLWDVASRRLEPVQVLREARDSVTSLQVTGHEILTSSADGHIRLYDIRVGRVTSDYVGGAIAYASLTHDGQCCAVSGEECVRLLDKDSGELLATYAGHSARDLAIENATDCADSLIVSGSASGEIWFWDLISGSCAFRLTHTAGRVVHSVSHHPTQSALLSASDDTIKLWSEPDRIDDLIL